MMSSVLDIGIRHSQTIAALFDVGKICNLKGKLTCSCNLQSAISLPCHQLSHSELLCFGIGHNLPFLGESETELAQLDPLWRWPHVSESKWIRWASRVKNIKLLAVVFVFLQDHLKTSILGKSMLKVRSLSVSSPHRTDALILIGAAVPWKNLHVHGFVNKVNSVQKKTHHQKPLRAGDSSSLWHSVNGRGQKVPPIPLLLFGHRFQLSQAVHRQIFETFNCDRLPLSEGLLL